MRSLKRYYPILPWKQFSGTFENPIVPHLKCLSTKHPKKNDSKECFLQLNFYCLFQFL